MLTLVFEISTIVQTICQKRVFHTISIPTAKEHGQDVFQRHISEVCLFSDVLLAKCIFFTTFASGMNQNRIFLQLLLVCALVARAQTDGIVFADDSVRDLCVAHWDADGDGVLSYEEAEAVTSLDSVFFLQTRIRSFDELQYFTGLKTLNRIALSDCYDLQSVTLPPTLEVLGERALWSCISITHLCLPPTLRRMEKGCLYHCKLLEDITIPGGGR